MSEGTAAKKGVAVGEVTAVAKVHNCVVSDSTGHSVVGVPVVLWVRKVTNLCRLACGADDDLDEVLALTLPRVTVVATALSAA